MTIDITPFQSRIRQFVQRIRSRWQLIMMLAFFSYGTSALYFFYAHPSPRSFPLKTVNLINNITFFIALVLAILIFLQKSRIFSSRFSATFLKTALQEHQGHATSALEDYLSVIAQQLYRFWILALAIIITGVCHFWLTLWPQYLHLLFIVGLFSLFLNYPRREFFSEIPFQLQRLKMDYDQGL